MNIGVTEFSLKINQIDVVVLDVRTPEEFCEGHINGAINFNFYDSNFMDEVLKISRTVTFALYCRSGKRSGSAASLIVDAGFPEPFNLEGGVLAWSGEDQPLVK